MCMMTVRYTESSGGETVMENVIHLEQRPNGIILEGLFDEPRMIDRAKVMSIDFSRSVTFVALEDAA